jgi:cysteine-rich repeat protein
MADRWLPSLSVVGFVLGLGLGPACAASLDGAFGNGVWLVVGEWVISDPVELRDDLFVQRSTDGGINFSPRALLNADGAVDSRDDVEPALATDGAGTWLAVWTSRGAGASDDGIKVARSTDDGLTWTAPSFIDASSPFDGVSDSNPDVVTDGTGTWVAAWRGYLNGVRFARSTDDGVTWSAPTAPAPFLLLHLVTAGAGNWGALVFDGEFVRSDDAFVTWSTAVPIGPHVFKRVAAAGPGSYVAVGIGDPSDPPNDIEFSRSLDAGATWEPAGILSDGGGPGVQSQTLPTVATDGAGTCVAAWTVFNSFEGRMAVSFDGCATWTPPAPTTVGQAEVMETDRAGTYLRWEAYFFPPVVWDRFGICGDGFVGAHEGCEDGNSVDGDGCESTCTPTGCGNGTVESGEQCDDGNLRDGDCCSAACLAEPAGRPCADDGNPCTDEACSGTGTCAHPNNTRPCDDGNACTFGDTCGGGACAGVATPQTCESLQAGRGFFLLRDRSPDIGDRLRWRWRKGDIDHHEGPVAHALCLFDASGLAQPRLKAVAPGESFFWRTLTGPDRIEYIDPTGTMDGVTFVRMRPGLDGKAKILFQADGDALDMPTLPLTPPVRAQLHAETGRCWETTYTATLRNDATLFRAKLP